MLKTKKRKKQLPKRRPRPPQVELKTTVIGRRLADRPYSCLDGLTQSILGSFVHCRTQAKYKLQGWQAEGTKEGLMFGALFHFLLEHYYKRIRAGKVKKPSRVWVEDKIEKWRVKELKKDGTIAQTLEVVAAQAYPTFIGYVDHWTEDADPKLWLELEGVFEVDFEAPDMLTSPQKLRGMFDGLQAVRSRKKRKKGKKKRKRTLRLFETKTKSQIESRLEAALAFNFQNLFYLTALNILLTKRGKKPCTKVLYNIVRRPGFKLGKNTGSPAALEKKIKDDIKKRPEHYFQRIELSYTLKEQERFQKELARKIQGFRTWWGFVQAGADQKGMAGTYRNELACMGKWYCAFIDACGSGEMHGYQQSGKLFAELADD